MYTAYELNKQGDVLLSQFGSSPLFHVQFKLLLFDLHADFSRGRQGVLAYPSLYFPQFVVIHTVKVFGVVTKAELGVFLELTCFFDDPTHVDNLLSGSSANIHWIIKTAREFQKNIYFCFIDYIKAFVVWITTNWKILKEMGISDNFTCLLRNLYVGQEAKVRTGHGTTDWFNIGKGV